MADIFKTLGTAARDYSTFAAFHAAITGANYSNGDVPVAQVYNDSVFDEAVTFVNGDLGGGDKIAGLRIEVPESERHDGTPGTGARIAYTGSAVTILEMNHTITSGALAIRCSDLAIDASGAGSTCLLGFWSHDQAAIDNVTVDHMLIYGFSTGGGHIWALRIDNNDAGNTQEVSRCAIFNIAATDDASASNSAIGLTLSPFADPAGDLYAYNCTIHDVRCASSTSDAWGLWYRKHSGNHLYNNIATDTTNGEAGDAEDFHLSGTGTVDAANNESSDATAPGTGSDTSISSSTEYVSTVRGSEDLHLDTGATALLAGTDLGTTTGEVERDIDGYDLGAVSVGWDRGYHQKSRPEVSFSERKFPRGVLRGITRGVA